MRSFNILERDPTQNRIPPRIRSEGMLLPIALFRVSQQFWGCTSDSGRVQWLARSVGIYYVDGKPVRAAKALIFCDTRSGAGNAA